MKKLFILAALLIAFQAGAQSFEGTLTWSLKQNPPDASGQQATSLTIKAKGTSRTAVLNGGMMNGVEMWYLNNGAKIMRIMRPQKKFMVVPAEAMAAAAKASETSKFVKTTETAKILNYTCVKYTGEQKTQAGTKQVIIWTTTEIKDDQKVLAHNPDLFGNPKLPEGVEGVPLKIEEITAKGSGTMEVTEIKPEKLGDEVFKVPADFKEMGKP